MKAGIDYDSVTDYLANKPMLLAIFGEIRERASASGRGVHVLVNLDDDILALIGGDAQQVRLAIRELCGDDKNRIEWDLKRLEHGQRTDRLFTYKDGNQAGKWKLINTL